MSGDSKSSYVQEQVIAHLRHELQELRAELDLERSKYRELVVERDRDVKAAQRQASSLATSQSHHEIRAIEFERDARESKAALLEERRLAKEFEMEISRTQKEAAWKLNQAGDKIARLEAERDMAKAEVLQMKNALEAERSAAGSLIKEHAEEMKMMREDYRRKTCELYKELHDRDTREQEEIKNIRQEADKTVKLMEKDFRRVLADKDEQLRQIQMDAKEVQRSLEAQLRESFQTSVGRHSVAPTDKELIRSYKQEISALRAQMKRLERQLTNAQDAALRSTSQQRSVYEETLAGKEKDGRGDALKLLQELKRKDDQLTKARNWIQRSKSELEKLRFRISFLRKAGETTKIDIEHEKKKTKPQLPIKSAKVLETKMASASKGRKLHVKEMVRQLQEKAQEEKLRHAVKKTTSLPLDKCLGDDHTATTSRTIADLQAIDEDLEKLRQQIEDRDRIILHLREAAKEKDEKMQQMTTEPTKQKSCNCLPLDIISRKRANKVDENQVVSEEINLSETLASLRLKESALIAEVALLRERESALSSEATQLREQNDLLEFRILELEECCPSPLERGRWSDDSGGMSLTTSEDLTSASDSDPGDTFGLSSCSESKLTGVATVFSSSLTREKSPKNKSFECLQESGIFEGSFTKEDAEVKTECIGCQTDWNFIPEKGEQFNRSDYINFYEERLNQLQEKLAIYESSGQSRDKLLSKRLEKEFIMANKIRELNKKIDDLEEKNQSLEEEKCEFEEAENDTRLQWQRMEQRVHELLGDKIQLEVDVDKKKQVMTTLKCQSDEMVYKMAKLQSNLNLLKNKTEEDARMLSALQSHLVERTLQGTDEPVISNQSLEALEQDKVMLTKLQEHLSKSELFHEDDATQKNNYDNLLAYSNGLKESLKISTDAKEMGKVIVELRLEVDALKNKTRRDEEKVQELETLLQDRDSKLRNLLQLSLNPELGDSNREEVAIEGGDFAREQTLKDRIDILERTNQAFIKALSDADQVWAQMEGEYKKQISRMQNEHESLVKKMTSENESLRTKVDVLTDKLLAADEKASKVADLEMANEALKTQLEIVLDEASAKIEEYKLLKHENETLKETVQLLKDEAEKEKRKAELRLMEKGKLLEELEKLLEQKVIDFNEELAQKNRALSDLEVTTSELREEVDTLEAQKSLSPVNSAVELRITVTMDEEESKGNTGAKPLKAITDKDPTHSVSAQVFQKVADRTFTLIAELFDILHIFELPRLEGIKSNHKFDEEKFADVEDQLSSLRLKSEGLSCTLAMLEREAMQKEAFDWQEQELSQLRRLSTELRESMSEIETWILHRAELSDTSGTSMSMGTTTDRTYTQPPKLSTLQIALDNLQAKCRSKAEVAKALLGLRMKSSKQQIWNIIHKTNPLGTSNSSLSIIQDRNGKSAESSNPALLTFKKRFIDSPPTYTKWGDQDNNVSVDTISEDRAPEDSERSSRFTGTVREEYESSHTFSVASAKSKYKTPEGPSEKCTKRNSCEKRKESFEKCLNQIPPNEMENAAIKTLADNCDLHRTAHNVNLGPTFPIVELKKLGYGRLLVAWDSSSLPKEVIGYEITVNGKSALRVHNRNIRKAVLKHLEAAYRLVVCVHPLLADGSTLEPATTVFPPLI